MSFEQFSYNSNELIILLKFSSTQATLLIFTITKSIIKIENLIKCWFQINVLELIFLIRLYL